MEVLLLDVGSSFFGVTETFTFNDHARKVETLHAPQ